MIKSHHFHIGSVCIFFWRMARKQTTEISKYEPKQALFFR